MSTPITRNILLRVGEIIPEPFDLLGVEDRTGTVTFRLPKLPTHTDAGIFVQAGLLQSDDGVDFQPLQDPIRKRDLVESIPGEAGGTGPRLVSFSVPRDVARFLAVQLISRATW